MKFFHPHFGLYEQRKNSVMIRSSFELVYGREDQQPFDIAVQLTKGLYKSSDEVILEKFMSHYQWVMEAVSNIKNALSI